MGIQRMANQPQGGDIQPGEEIHEPPRDRLGGIDEPEMDDILRAIDAGKAKVPEPKVILALDTKRANRADMLNKRLTTIGRVCSSAAFNEVDAVPRVPRCDYQWTSD